MTVLNGASSSARKRKAKKPTDDVAHEVYNNVDDLDPPAKWTIDIPSDPINEQVVLGAMIVGGPEVRARIQSRFPDTIFYATEHRAIAHALREMDRRKLRYDPATLMRIGGDDFDIRVLEAIAEARPELPPNLDFHLATLAWDWERAKITQGPIASLLEAIQNPNEAPERVVALAKRVGELSRPVAPGEANDGPLAGLPTLSSVSLVGRDAIMAAAERPIVWLWASYVVAGQVVMLFGAPGSGKTTLLFIIVIALATSTPIDVLGRRVEPAPDGSFIVLIEGEHEAGSAARKLAKSVEVLGVDDAALDRVILIARKEVRVGSPGWLEVRELTRRGLVAAIFVDSLARFSKGDANNEQEQIEVFAEVSAALESAPEAMTPTAWIIAHGRKSANGDVDDVSGSAQRAAQADTILFVKATKDDDDKVISSRVTAVKLREEPEEWPKAVEFSIAKDDAAKWRCVVGGASARPEDTPRHERVFTFLADADAPKTKNEIRDALKMNADSLEKALTTLFAEKRIRKTERTVAGKKRDAFAARAKEKAVDGPYKFGSAQRRARRKAAG